MGLLTPRPASERTFVRIGRKKKTASMMMISQPQKRHPLTENICEICGTLKKKTRWNEVLFAYICTSKSCREIERAQTKVARREQRREERAKQQEALLEAFQYEIEIENLANNEEQVA